MNFICYNHQALPEQQFVLHVDNPAFRSGAGLIETMLWENGQVRFWPEHFERLTASAGRLKWNWKRIERISLLDSIRALIARNNITGKCMLRLQAFPEAGDTGFILETLSFPETDRQNRVGIVRGLVKNTDAYSDLKTSSRLIYHIARREAEDRGWTDALILNREGRIVESTIANIFWIRNKQAFTPPLNEGCVAGVMREQILSGKMTIQHLPVSEKALTIDEARSADQLLLTNAVRGIRRIDLFCPAR